MEWSAVDHDCKEKARTLRAAVSRNRLDSPCTRCARRPDSVISSSDFPTVRHAVRRTAKLDTSPQRATGDASVLDSKPASDQNPGRAPLPLPDPLRQSRFVHCLASLVAHGLVHLPPCSETPRMDSLTCISHTQASDIAKDAILA